MFNSETQCCVALLVSAALSYPAYAVPTEEDFTLLSLNELVELEVFTAASLLPTQTKKAPGTVYSFHRQDFDLFGVRRLDDLLAFVPGLQLNQYRKRHRSVWARGLLDRYNDKMVLMVDGVRIRHLYYGHFSLGDNLPLELIEKVEIILGPASSLYGANAFGGIISITTREFSNADQLELTAEVADNDRKKAGFLYNTPEVQIFASALDQDAPFREDRKSFIGGDVLQPLDEEFQNLHIKASPMPGLTLRLMLNKSETPFLNIPTTQDASIDEDFLSLSLDYQWGDLQSGRVESKLYYQDDKTREIEIEQETRALGYEEYQDATMAGASFTWLKAFGDHSLAVGSSWQYEKAKRTDFERFFHFKDGFLSPTEKGNLLNEPGISNNDWALFIQDVWQVNPELGLTFGGRYDQFGSFGGYFNYRAAAVYAPDDRNTWKAQYGTAIRTPTFREYLKVLEGTNFEAPDVEAEEIKSLELAYQYQWGQANISLNLFHNELENYISEVPTPDMADEYFANVDGTVQMRGAEMLLNMRPLDQVNVRLALAYLETDSETIELPYLASWSSSFKVDYLYLSNHLVGFSLVHSDVREDTNNFERDNADEFVITNLFASGEWKDGLSYRFGVDNFFDKKVYDPAADFGSQHNNERSEREIWFSLKWNKNLL
ncbi:TonB-dependent receptor plug domain-containing protein [Neptuniibacter sp. QD72_48]|uniref:TonB-dependent receptor plug domain-containing protein n=1 Tax=Neptuniibacter sp. QD72_48 TaxID=3398214 RepID=UPI0039F5F411